MSLDSDLDRLYQLPPSEFIAERNTLAKRAGTAGADIRALPKPTLPVWAVNQLHWREPDVYRALVESAENLRATHKAVLGGKRGDLRAASRAHEQALDAALKAALRIAADGGSPASDAARQTIATTLRALPAADPPGRLRQALTPGGFEALAGLGGGAPSAGEAWQAVGVPPSPGLRRASPKLSGGGGPHGKPRKAVPAGAREPGPSAKSPAATAGRGKPSKTAAPEKRIDRAALERANKAAEAAARAVASAEQAARREEFEAARATREAEKAERRVTRAKEALAAAQAELDEAEAEAAGSARARDAAQARSEAADQTLETARERADEAKTAVAKAQGQA